MREARPAPADTTDYIRFGDVARDRCGMQCQYASRYLPELGADLLWFGDTASYHGLHIHREDADMFVARLREHRIAGGCGWSGEPPAICDFIGCEREVIPGMTICSVCAHGEPGPEDATPA